MQLKQEVFQNDESCVNQNAVEIQEYFEINDLKARLQDKDTTISKLNDTIKSLKMNTKENNVHHDKCDLEPINEELENSVAKLLSENEQLWNEINHVKQVFKDQFDSIKQTCVRHKEQWKEIVENVVHIPSATTIAPGMFKLDLVPLPPRLLQNREVHINYLRNTQEQANILREIELLVYVQDTCPNAIIPSTKKVVVTPMNNVKRLVEPLTSSSNIKQVVQILLWYLDSGCSEHMTGNRSQLMNFVSKFLGTVRFRVREHNLYTISLDDMLKSSPICLLSKASKTKSWLWHRRLSHLNFGTLNKLAKWRLARGIPRFLKTKDEAPAAIIKCIKNIQVRLKATVQNVRTDNGTEFVNQTLRECSGPGLHGMTPATSSTGLVSNLVSQQPFQEAAALRAEVLVDSPVSTLIDQDVPSIKSPKIPTFHDDPLNESPNEDSTSHGSSSNVRQIHSPLKHIGRWTKDHLIANVIGDPSRSVSIIKQLHTDAM
ncbi:integrase, catalytic region, zinc finger, CCHC-type containing protein [Tanacetum coccineum]